MVLDYFIVLDVIILWGILEKYEESVSDGRNVFLIRKFYICISKERYF